MFCGLSTLAEIEAVVDAAPSPQSMSHTSPILFELATSLVFASTQ